MRSIQHTAIRSLVALAALTLAAAPAPGAEPVEVSGRVLLPDRGPLAEAAILLLPFADPVEAARAPQDGTAPEPVARARTGRDGRFVLAAPEPGFWRLEVRAEGHVPMEALLLPLIDPRVLPDLVLDADAGLTVAVRGGDGAPLAGALARIEREGVERGASPTWEPAVRRARTAADGTVRLPRGARERVRLDLVAPAHEPRRLEALRGNAAEVRLQAGTPVRWRVVGADGEPVADASILDRRSGIELARTAADGTARFVPPAGDDAAVRIAATDGRRLALDPASIAATPATPADVSGAAADAPRPVRLPDARYVGGRVIDRETRRPVTGALIWDRSQPEVSTRAGDDGGFLLRAPEGRTLDLSADAPGYLRARGLEFAVRDDGRPGPTFALVPGVSVAGRVLDAAGEPVEGAEVSARVKQAPGNFRIELGGPPPPRALSDEDGRYRISALDPGSAWELSADAADYAPAKRAVSGLEPRAALTGVDLKLERGGTVRGRVVDAEGVPLSVAEVELAPAAEGGPGGMRILRGESGPAASGWTDDDGAFALRGIPAGTFELTVRRAGFARGKVEAIEVAGEPVDLGDVALVPGERLEGVVTDAGGAPLAGAELRLADGGGPRLMLGMGPGENAPDPPDATTDEGGWFSIADLAPGETHALRVSRPSYVARTVRAVEVPRVEPLTIALEAASTVSGRVRDSRGEPVADARVDLRRMRTVEMGNMVMQTIGIEQATSDASGRFVFRDQEPGEIALIASAPGFQQAERADLEIPPGKDLEDVVFELVAGAILEGRVLTPDGRPAIGASVGPVGEGGDGLPGMSFGDDGATDGNGYYRLENLKPGRVSIQATHDDHPRTVRDLDLREGINGLDLRFSGGHAVRGRVVDETGKPVPAAGVRLAAPGRFWGGPEAVAGPDGRFELTGVEDGAYELHAAADGFARPSGRPVEVAGAPLEGLEIALPRGATIRGTVAGIDPLEFPKLSVSARGEGHFGESARIGREGTFRIDHVAPGSYEVVAVHGETGRQARDTVTIAAGAAEVQVDLRFADGVDLDGLVTEEDDPVIGANVHAVGLDIDHSAWSQTDRGGRFRLEGLPPGRYRVDLNHWDTGLAHSEELDVATSREVVIEVPTATVVGRIVDSASREPLAGVAVELDPEGETRRFSARHADTTDLEGRFRLNHVGDGAWRLTARKPGYAAVGRDVEVRFQRAADRLDLEMEPTDGLELVARLPGGGVPDAVSVAVLDPSGQPIVQGRYPTGENGSVRLTTVPRGRWELVAGASGSATVGLPVEAPSTGVPLTLPPATRLLVRVPELESSAVLARARLVAADGRPARALDWAGNPRSEFTVRGGRLERIDLPPGTWTVTVQTPDGRSWSGEATTAPGVPAEAVLE